MKPASATIWVHLLEQLVQNARLDQRLAEIPKRIRIRNLVTQIHAAKARPAQTVANHMLRRLQRQAVKALQNQHLELQNDVQRRSTALRAARPPGGRLEDRPEPVEIHRRRKLLQRVPVGRDLREAIVNVPKTQLFRHHDLQFCQSLGIMPSSKTQGVFGGVQLLERGRQLPSLISAVRPDFLDVRRLLQHPEDHGFDLAVKSNSELHRVFRRAIG